MHVAAGAWRGQCQLCWSGCRGEPSYREQCHLGWPLKSKQRCPFTFVCVALDLLLWANFRRSLSWIKGKRESLDHGSNVPQPWHLFARKWVHVEYHILTIQDSSVLKGWQNDCEMHLPVSITAQPAHGVAYHRASCVGRWELGWLHVFTCSRRTSTILFPLWFQDGQPPSQNLRLPSHLWHLGRV